MYLFSIPWKHQKTVRFSDVFRGSKKGELGTNGLIKIQSTLTRIWSTELHRTGSVKSSSAFSNQLLNSDAFFANSKQRSSTCKFNVFKFDGKWKLFKNAYTIYVHVHISHPSKSSLEERKLTSSLKTWENQFTASSL